MLWLDTDCFNLPVVNFVPRYHFQLETQQLHSVVLAICEPSSPHMLAALTIEVIKEIGMRVNKSYLYSFILKPSKILPKKYNSVY